MSNVITTPGIEVFRGSDLVYDGLVAINSVVRPTLERMLRMSLKGAIIRLYLLSVPEQPVDRGSPVLRNLLPDFGYAYVTVIVSGNLVYQHPHPIEDLMNEQLRRILRERRPDETMWSFRISVQRRESQAPVRPVPEVNGVVNVAPSNGEAPSFGIRRISEEPPPPRALSEFAITPNGGDGAAPIKVLLPRALSHEIATRPMSAEVEEGGFLLGRVYAETGADGAFIVHLTGADTADYTGASFLHFTFTGDSFAAVKRTLREQRPSDRLLGWYHTHLFPATEEMGLSTIDETLHHTTFTLPWQIAGLLNLDRGTRTLRFYARRGDEMVRCPHWVLND